MLDRREEVLLSAFNKHKEANPADNWASWDRIKKDGSAQISFDAMDEYSKQLCLELIRWMLNHGLFALRVVDGQKMLYCRGEYITPEQLFENFL